VSSASVTDKTSDRPLRNALSAVAMLGHLCGLYDRGVYEAGRLMANLVFQLVIERRKNAPLLKQIGHFDRLRIVIDSSTLSTEMPASPTMSPLVSLMFGLKADSADTLKSAAIWLPAFRRPPPHKGFESMTIDAWLDDAVIPTTTRILTRRELVQVIRDQDGGAHSDPDAKLAKSPDYAELVNAFPISKHSHVVTPSATTIVWEVLPPVTMPILRQVAHELLSTIYSQSDVGNTVYPPTLVCLFRDTTLTNVVVPEDYPKSGPIYGLQPTVVARSR